jgi:predicted permease
MFETTMVEVRYAVRRLVKAPAFAVVASLSLALGLGVTIAAFSVLYAVLFRALPVRDAGALVVVSTRNAGAQYSMSHAVFAYLRDHSSSLEVVSFRALPVNVSTGGATDRVTGMLVSGNYFAGLGVAMTLGTPILPEDDRVPGAGGTRGIVAVIGHRFWTRAFGADAGILGRTIRVNGHPVTVVGVAPADFEGTRIGSLPDVFLPMMFAPHAFEAPNWLANPRNNWLRIMGRLRPGVPRSTAEAEMTTTFRQFHRDVIVPLAATEAARRRARDASIVLEPGYTGLFEMDSTVRPTLFSLMGLVALVLLIAFVNVAGLMAARAERLHRDTAICLALGATSRRLWSRHFLETFLVAFVGLGLALVVGASLSDLFARLLPAGQHLRIGFDSRVLGLSAMLGLLTTIGLTAVVARQATRVGIGRALKGDDITARLWLRKGLIVAQFALSVVVLASAALFGQTVGNLRLVDLGFEPHRVLLATIAPTGYSPAERKQLFSRILDDVRGIPGVVSAAVANDEPLDVSTGWNIVIRGERDAAPRNAEASVSFISPDYLETMGIPLVRGRGFKNGDETDPVGPVIVNEHFVRSYLTTDGLGTRIAAAGRTFEVVGVARDSAALGLRDRDQHMMYVPGGDGVLFLRDAVLHVRTSVPPSMLQPAVEGVVHRLDPGIPVFNVRTIEQQIDRFVAREQTFALLASTFGMAAVVLCVVGLYGVITNAVSRRTKELAVRLALGAGPGRVVALVVEEAGALAVVGIAIGVPCAFLLARSIRTLLYGVRPGDWKSVTIAMALLLVAAGAAAFLPARRASRVDPLLALRAE